MKLIESVKNAIENIKFADLDLVESGTFREQFESLVMNHGFDFLIPFTLYSFLSPGNDQKSKYILASFIFASSSLYEFGQKLDLLGGTYDQKDFLAYATGTLLALGIDSILYKISKKKESIDNVIESAI